MNKNKILAGVSATAIMLTSAGSLVGAIGIPTKDIKYQNTIENLKQDELGIDLTGVIYWKKGESKLFKYNNNKLEEVKYSDGSIQGTEVKNGDQFLLRNVGTHIDGKNLSVRITLDKMKSSRPDGKNFFGLWINSIESNVNPNKAITFTTSENREKAESAEGEYLFEFLYDEDLTPVEITTGGVFQLYHKTLGSVLKEDLSNKKVLASEKGKEFNTINEQGELVAIKDVPANITYNNFDYTGYLGFGTGKQFKLTIKDTDNTKKTVDNFRLFGTYEWSKGVIEKASTMKIKTYFVDENGIHIAKPILDKEKASKKDIPGYEFIKEEKLSDTEYRYVYKKTPEVVNITTYFVNEKGDKILDPVKGKDKVEKKDIPGYEFVKEEKLSDTEYRYVYKKTPEVVNITTYFVDEKGDKILEPVKSKNKIEKKDISGYEFVKEEKLSDTEYRYVYKKINKKADVKTGIENVKNNIVPISVAGALLLGGLAYFIYKRRK